MAKEIIWSSKALRDRAAISDYWRERNQSSAYSIELDNKFIKIVELISKNPKIGKRTDRDARLKIAGDYHVIYRETHTSIDILRIWDARQDPEKLKY